MERSLIYRPEIDGLRALAVIPVVLCHAGLEAFSGGYVGVDVFFVISGFLITGILLEELSLDSFSFIRFYERRARRILPALLAVVIASVPFAWLWMLPEAMENFGQSIVATLLFSNNILLFLTSGYWDLAAEFKPLLHTWSLGVEEQYYLIFPVILTYAFRRGRTKALVTVVALAVLSFVIGELSWRNDPKTSFWLSHTRAWELLLGSVAAFFVRRNPSQGNSYLSAAGLACILCSIWIYDSTTPFPSYFALLPCLGTVLILLYADATTLTARILSVRALVGIGIISYSVYLWHQPIFAFSRVYFRDEPQLMTNLSLALLTLPLSIFSWKFIEQPFRNAGSVRTKSLLVWFLVPGFLLIFFGASAHFSHGFVGRVFKETDVDKKDLFIGYNSRNYALKVDSFGDSEGVNILVVGNSFARDIVNVLRETYELQSDKLIYRDDFNACTLGTSSLGESLSQAADLIILSEDHLIRNNACILQLSKRGVESGAFVLVVGPKHFGYNLNWIARIDEGERALLRNPVDREVMAIDRANEDLVPGEHYLSLMRHLVAGNQVLVTDANGGLLSSDRLHLTRFGARWVGKNVFLNLEATRGLKASRRTE